LIETDRPISGSGGFGDGGGEISTTEGGFGKRRRVTQKNTNPSIAKPPATPPAIPPIAPALIPLPLGVGACEGACVDTDSVLVDLDVVVIELDEDNR
jgi:hypothetical protein